MPSHPPSLKIGTRGSRLALIQARMVEERLKARRPGLFCEQVIIKTQGEKRPGESLVQISGTGIFTRELDRALEEGRIDLAVHSLKDLPTELTEGIELSAVTEREAAEEAFVSERFPRFQDLGAGARVGTGSPRRRSQILALRPDLQVVDFRGNVETRLKKMESGDADALVLAAAGLIRLGLGRKIRERLPLEEFVPPPGQGALAVCVRRGNGEAASLAALVHDPDTARAVTAERAFLRRLGGGCKTPIACHAFFRDGRLEAIGLVASPDGRTVLQDRLSGPAEDGGSLGRALAEKLLSRGADQILKEE